MSNEICAACSGGPKEGKFTVKQVKSNRVTISNIEMFMPKMGHYDGVSVCGGCMARAIHTDGVGVPAAAATTTSQPKPPDASSAEAPAASGDETAFFCDVADAVSKLHSEGFDPNAIDSSVYYAAVSRSA